MMLKSESKTRKEIFAIDANFVHLLQQEKPEGVVEVEYYSYGANLPQKSNNSDKSVAVVNVSGIINYNFDFGSFASSTQRIKSEIISLVNDKAVSSIVLNVASPGGSVFGLTELSNVIYEARQLKRIVAVANPFALSAAYHIASSAEKLYVTKSGLVGSIGVVVVHESYAELLKKEGIVVTIVKAGANKWLVNPYEDLTKEAKERLQFEVDTIYDIFVSDVARNRGVSVDTVKKDFGQGNSLLAEEALQAGLVDGIMSFEDVLNFELESIRGEQSRLISKQAQQNKIFLSLQELTRDA